MIALVEANWPLFLVALLIGLAVAWLLFRGNRRTTVLRDDSGAQGGPAMRNQALIDAPPVAAATEAQSPQDSGGEGGSDPSGSDTDLTRIKGVGPKLAVLLRELGVTSLQQIAAWSDDDIDRIDARLGRFEGRIRRDDWVMQARLLANGDTGAYEARFGRLEEQARG